jgi:hypothetical protein
MGFLSKTKKGNLETEETTAEQISNFNYLRNLMWWRENINIWLKIGEMHGIIKWLSVNYITNYIKSRLHYITLTAQ